MPPKWVKQQNYFSLVLAFKQAKEDIPHWKG